MNSNLKLLPAALLVAVLAGCGGGGESTMSTADTDMQEQQMAVMSAKRDVDAAAAAAAALTVDSEKAAVDAAQAQITASTDALAKVVSDGYLTADEAAPYKAKLRKAQMMVSEQNGRLSQQADDAEEAMKKAKADAAKALNEMAMKLNAAIVVSRTVSGNTPGNAGTVSTESYGAGSGVEIHSSTHHIDATNKPFSNQANPVVIGDSMVTLQRVENGGFPGGASSRELKLTDQAVASLGAWQAKLYERKNADGEVLDTAVIYTNQGPNKRELFATKHADIITDGRVPQSASGFAALMPMSSEFRTTPGVKDHQLPASVTTRPDYISIGGTLDGAPGQFRCPTASGTVCTSTGTQAGGTTLSAGWYFIADAGAMTSTPDDKYAGFGWWAQEDSNGADGFYVVVRSGPDADAKFVPSATGGAAQIAAFNALSGTATYNGHAAGKVAIHQPLSSDGNVAGTFTADAALTVDFGAATQDASSIGDGEARLTGTIDGFMVNGMAMDDWTVKFVKNEGNTAANGFPDGGGITYTGNTEWSIGDTKGAGAGEYRGTFLDQADSGLPRATVGHFTAQYGSVGSMTGGFGATTTDPDE